jgi:prepilin-type N-terminal cleavage/methylation domain-containing protein
MKCQLRNSSRRLDSSHRRGFTLIELLVVIAIIGVLAALVVGGASHVRETSVRSRVKTELKQLETAIEAYHKKFGFYPPSGPNRTTNSLYYELTGQSFAAADANSYFGVNGIVNTQAGEDGQRVPNFLSNLGVEGKSYKDIEPNPAKEVFALTVPADGQGSDPNINPWRYVSVNPTNNTESYDLWAEVMVGSKKIVIGNWKD